MTESPFTLHSFHPDNRPAAATIGFFDGVHAGHRHLIDRLCNDAARRDLRPVAVTFDEHPRRVLHADYRPALLQTTEEKLAALADTGLSAVAVLHFTRQMATLTAGEFMQQILMRMLGVRYLLAGYDHRFGRPEGDTPPDYTALGRTLGLEVCVADPVSIGTTTVSSSVIRRLVASGEMETAATLLGRPYRLPGTVVEGRKVGRRIGFPTANLRPAAPELLLPAIGVYAAVADIADGKFPAMVNIGRRPTLDNGNDTTVEAHLIGYDGNLYHRPLSLRFITRLRNEQRFASLDELANRLTRDREAALRAVQPYIRP